MNLAERFWSKVNKRGPRAGRLGRCWVWTGATYMVGYGSIRSEGGRNGRTLGTHRVAWELANGPIPDGLCVLHRCDNRICVRLSHLWLGTKADNNRDMATKGRHGYPYARRAYCPAGHPYNKRNTYRDRNGWRYCRTCASARARQRQAA